MTDGSWIERRAAAAVGGDGGEVDHVLYREGQPFALSRREDGGEGVETATIPVDPRPGF